MVDTGQQFPATVVDDSTVGTITWANPGNAVSSNNSYAVASFSNGQTATTHYLKATNFGLGIPTGSTIDGIEVLVERKASASRISEISVRLVKAGSIVGNDNSIGASISTSEGTRTYGSATDLWGTTWTVAQVNASDFGAVWAGDVSNSVGATTLSVDAISVIVFYTVPSQTVSPGAIASAGALGSPTITTGPVSVLPTGITGVAAVGSPVVASRNTLVLTGIVSGEAVGTPTLLGTGVNPTGIASAEAFGTPVITTTVSVVPTGITGAAAVGSPSVAGINTITLTGIVSLESFGIPTIDELGVLSHEVVETSSIQDTLSQNRFLTFQNMQQDVQNWITEVTENNGWLVVSENENTGTFDSALINTREAAINTPVLTVQYADFVQPQLLSVEKGVLGTQTLNETGNGIDRTRVVRISIDEYIAGNQGPINYYFGLRQYNASGILVADISESVEKMKIDWDETKSVKRSLNFDVKSDVVLQETDLLEPYGILKMISPASHEEIQLEFVLGRYTRAVAKNRIGLSFNEQSVTALDRTSLLIDATVNEPLTVNAGASYAGTIRTLAIACGFKDEDILIPFSSVSIPTTRTWKQGTTYYSILTELADAVNWYSPFMDNDDKLRFLEVKDDSLALSNVTYATDEASMILADVSIESNTTRIPNRIVVAVNDPLRAPFSVTYTNNSVDNPYSLTNTGIAITEVVDNVDYMASSGTALDKAKYIAQDRSSATHIELKTWVDIRRKPHEIYALHVTDPETNQLVLFANWRCVAWSMNLDTGGEMSHQLKSILPV